MSDYLDEARRHAQRDHLPEPTPLAVIAILLYPNGQIKMDFPPDEFLARGLLDKGRSALDDHFRKPPSRIIPPGA